MRTHLARTRAPSPRFPAAAAPSRARPEVRQVLHAPRPQAKLTVGAPDDAFEREADEVADQVMRMPEPTVQRMCAECKEEEAKVRRAEQVNVPTPQTTQDEDEVRRKALPSGTGGGLEEEAVHAVSSKGSGRPLAEASRRFFEPRFGADFSAVRIHDGPPAERSARSLNARAFAYGSDIWLGAGERESNRPLLAHELVHVVQQRRAPSVPAALRRYVRTNTVHLWDLYDAAGRDPSAVTDAELRTTIEYEDYTRADLTWRFSDMVAIAALRRSLELFGSGVRGRGPNYIRSGREARAAAHGISSIFATELGFTGDHPITSVSGSLGGTKGAVIDAPDGSSPVWTIGGAGSLVSYTLGTAPTMFGRFSVVPPVASPVPDVQVRALVGGTIVGAASGLRISGDRIEDAAGGGRVTGIGGGAAIPGVDVGSHHVDFDFETSTDGGRIWFDSGSARVHMVFTQATPFPPGGDLREDVLDWGGLVIGSSATAAADLRRLVKALVTYDPGIGMPPSFTTGDDVMEAFRIPHQCDSQAYLLRYLARSFGIPADVVYFWYGAPGEAWYYYKGAWRGPTFQCDRPAEDRAAFHPHFTFHALTEIGGTLHDAAYDFGALPGILEHAPGATPQTGSRAAFTARTRRNSSWVCPH